MSCKFVFPHQRPIGWVVHSHFPHQSPIGWVVHSHFPHQPPIGWVLHSCPQICTVPQFFELTTSAPAYNCSSDDLAACTRSKSGSYPLVLPPPWCLEVWGMPWQRDQAGDSWNMSWKITDPQWGSCERNDPQSNNCNRPGRTSVYSPWQRARSLRRGNMEYWIICPFVNCITFLQYLRVGTK